MFPRLAAIIVLGFIAFGCMLPSPFKTMDDRVSIIDNPIIKSTANIFEIFRQGYFHDQHYYRPLVNLSYMGEYQSFGFNAFFYNLDNLILHIANAVLVFLLVSRLTNNESIGFWTGLLFVMHPVQWEAVCNISGRAILMSAFFELSSFLLFLKFYKNSRGIYLLFAVLTFFIGLLCKESAGVLPFVLILYLCLDKTNTWVVKLKRLGPFFIAIAAYGLMRFYFGITQSFKANDVHSLIFGFVTFLRSVITDLRLFIVPIDLHFDRCLPFFMSFSYPPAIFALVFWVSAVGALMYYRRKISSFTWFLILWFALELLPVSQLFVGIGVGSGWVSTAEHFLYVAAIPVLMAMVMVFRWMYESNVKKAFINATLMKFLAGGFLVFLLLTSIGQSIYASNEYTMLERSLFFEPNNPRIQGAMGILSVTRNDITDAEKHFRAAIKAEPSNPTYYISLGTALCQEGRWIEGLEQLVVFDPGKDKALVERQQKLAMIHINEQLALGKNFDARGWLAIGIYYAKAGQNSQAIDAFLKSVNLNPKQTDAWFNLGSLYEAGHHWAEASNSYKKVLGLQDLTLFQRNFAMKHLEIIEDR